MKHWLLLEESERPLCLYPDAAHSFDLAKQKSATFHETKKLKYF